MLSVTRLMPSLGPVYIYATPNYLLFTRAMNPLPLEVEIEEKIEEITLWREDIFFNMNFMFELKKIYISHE